MSTCDNNPTKSSTTKINKHTPSGYSLFTICSFDTTKIKLDYYRGEHCMENFCIEFREEVTKIINYKEEEMISLTNEEKDIRREQKVCYICKKGFSTDDDYN